MDRTPKTKSLKFARSSPLKEVKKKKIWNNDGDNQETNDVLWDWDSPKNIRPKSVRVRKMEVYKSPISAQKKTSQTDHIKNYEKLKQELQALKDEIARTDDCIPISPIDEQIFKEEHADSEINSFIEEQYFHIENQEIEARYKPITDQYSNETVNELFDDDCDEQLYLCTQMIEEKLEVVCETSKEEFQKPECDTADDNGAKKNMSIAPVENKLINSLHVNDSHNHLNIVDQLHSRSVNDSFDAILLQFEDEDINILTQNKNIRSIPEKIQNKETCNFKRTVSDANVQYHSNSTEKSNSKSEFHRTQSFDSTSTVKNKDKLPKYMLEEIERKRKEALARLEKKRLHSNLTNSDDGNNTITCFPYEIEKKRLQAKALRDAKQKEIIEKNRQEAMRRLEFNKRKRLGNLSCQKRS